jgi:hypothetical protein
MHIHFVCLLTYVVNCGRALEEKRARLGLVECMNHELLQPYPVLHEKQGSQDNPLTLEIVYATPVQSPFGCVDLLNFLWESDEYLLFLLNSWDVY